MLLRLRCCSSDELLTMLLIPRKERNWRHSFQVCAFFLAYDTLLWSGSFATLAFMMSQPILPASVGGYLLGVVVNATRCAVAGSMSWTGAVAWAHLTHFLFWDMLFIVQVGWIAFVVSMIATVAIVMWVHVVGRRPERN